MERVADDQVRTSPGVGIRSTFAFDTTFGLERDLQMALRSSIEQLEPGLAIIDGGHEQTVTSGRIDITARDKDGSTVVIELKAGLADRDVIGQILSYMGDVTDGSRRVRGIVIAKEFSPRAISAARAVSNVQFVQYSIQFKFGTISTSSKRSSINSACAPHSHTARSHVRWLSERARQHAL